MKKGVRQGKIGKRQKLGQRDWGLFLELTDDGWHACIEVLRTTSCCAVTGESAGIDSLGATVPFFL